MKKEAETIHKRSQKEKCSSSPRKVKIKTRDGVFTYCLRKSETMILRVDVDIRKSFLHPHVGGSEDRNSPWKAIWPYLQALPWSTDSHQRVNPGNLQSVAQRVHEWLQSLAWAGAPADWPHLHPEATWWRMEPAEQQRLTLLVPGCPHTPRASYSCMVKFCYCSKFFYIF